MKLYIKQKVFSWKDRFTVKDVAGADRYFIESELFSFAKKLHVYDAQGREVAMIKQELWTWLPRYYVCIDGHEVATIRKELTLLRPRYRVDGLDWEINGSFWEHDYEIRKDGQKIVTICKQWLSWGDTYELDIANPQDEIAALAVVLTIDCVMQSSSNTISVSVSN